MIDPATELMKRITRGIDGFSDEMKSQGIHVGLGKPGEARCVTCGGLWPCAESKAS